MIIQSVIFVLSLLPPFFPFLCVRGRVQNSSLADWQITKRQVNSNSDNNKKLKPVTQEQTNNREGYK